MGSAITLILIVVVFVLLIIVPYRRQAQRQRAVRAMQSALQPGAEVMTTSGLFGTVVSVGDTAVELEIAPGIVIRVARGAIGEMVQPVQAVPAETDEDYEYAADDDDDATYDDAADDGLAEDVVDGNEIEGEEGRDDNPPRPNARGDNPS